MCLPWRKGQYLQECVKSGKGSASASRIYAGLQEDRASRRSGQLLTTNLLRRGLQIRQKVGFFRPKALCLHESRSEAAYRDAAIYRRFILLRFVVDHIAQHREQHYRTLKGE